jgi:peptide/nickel transport system substrate-binding protein
MNSRIEASSGQLSRRTLLAGSALLLAPAVLAACGVSPAPSAGGTATGTARQGGTLRIARPPASKAETLDPASSLSAYEYLGALYSRLVKLSPTGEIVKDLADSWSLSADALSWTFVLKKGVTWHDGKPFNAQDVIYSIQHILDPATKSPQAGVLSPFVDGNSIAAPDANTVVFTLKSPNAEFASLLTGYNCYIIPAGSAATIGASGIGTGPFKLKNFTAAGPGAVVRNENYFGDKPKLDAIEFSSIADTQARVNALLAGQVDLIAQTNLDFATAKSVSASSVATVSSVKNAQWYPVPMLNTSEQFKDPDIRRAFAHAYNPEEVFKLAVQGNGTIARNNPVPPTEAYYLDYGLGYDPDKSKSLLKAKGFDTFEVPVYTSSYDPVLSPLALALQSSMKSANINLTVTNSPADSYFTDVWMKTLDAARATVDAGKRKTLYQDAQKILIDDGGSLTPFFSDRITGLSKKVVNYKEHGFEFDYINIGLQA